MHHFISNKYAKTTIGLNYFLIAHVKITHEPLYPSKHSKTIKYILLVTKLKGYNNYYHTAISNNCHIVNKLGEFQIIHDLNYRS